MGDDQPAARRGSTTALSRWWSVALRPGASVKGVYAVVPGQLAQLEREGVTEFQGLTNPFSEPSGDAAVRAIEEVLEQAGVDQAFSLEASNGGLSFVVQKPGGPIGAADVVEAIETEAWKEDNRQKLAAMPTDERHLFVWIDFSRPGAHGVLRLGILPIPEPRLPSELTTLWLAARMSDDRNDWSPTAARRLDRPGAWIIV